MRRMLASAAALALCVMASARASGAVFQYKIMLPGEKGESPAYMWIPADAKQVRGIVYMGTTVAERELAKDPLIRKACAEQGLGIILLRGGISSADVQKVLDQFAEVSGYREVKNAPLFFAGHSAGGPQAKDAAVKYADRCFGLMQYRGGGPFDGTPVAAGTPTLIMMGEFDEYGGVMKREGGRSAWDNVADRVGEHRAKNEAYLASIVVEPGAGHFAWSDRNAKYLAMFIAKAAKAKIPATWDVNGDAPPKLLEIDYKTGWLTPTALRTLGTTGKAQAYDKYEGDKTKTAWYFDEEMADAAVKFHAGQFTKKDQFIKWNDAYWVDAGTRYFFNGMKWVGDGSTMEVNPSYADKYPATQPDGRGPKWLQAGQPVGHSKAPILVKIVIGPAEVVGPNTFRVKFDNVSPVSDGVKLNFMAYSEGDDEYRYTEIVGMTPRGMKDLGGKDQKIDFPPIGNVKVGSGPVELKGKSDSGLKVEYYVAQGPAEIVDGKLVIQELPARAKFPVEVKVVAYQYGSGVEPKFRTATPVEQTVLVEK